ncbi:hypothetical protein E2C01_085711 [Portunus trituberculatus]|uniref:Uncharacterized protein n=1 Tax=Portunus trituberculatus TaxID=210409 RepID=A0A5B7JED6_PORTR|nr:hypothetical protein [Portunus trituberculatus]
MAEKEKESRKHAHFTWRISLSNITGVFVRPKKLATQDTNNPWPCVKVEFGLSLATLEGNPREENQHVSTNRVSTGLGTG